VAKPPPPSVEGRDSSALPLVAQRLYGSKQQVLVAFSKWTIFVRHVTISAGRELRRIPIPRTRVNKGKGKGRGC
jgi:hypothetical protein